MIEKTKQSLDAAREILDAYFYEPDARIPHDPILAFDSNGNLLYISEIELQDETLIMEFDPDKLGEIEPETTPAEFINLLNMYMDE